MMTHHQDIAAIQLQPLMFVQQAANINAQIMLQLVL